MARAHIQPSGMRVCDDRGKGCFMPYLVLPTPRYMRNESIDGTVGQLLKHQHWNDEHALAPLFLHAMRGTCVRSSSDVERLHVRIASALQHLQFGVHLDEC